MTFVERPLETDTWLRVSFRLSAPQARRPTRGIAHFQTQRLRFLLLNTVGRVIGDTHKTLPCCTKEIARVLAGALRTLLSLNSPVLAGV